MSTHHTHGWLTVLRAVMVTGRLVGQAVSRRQSTPRHARRPEFGADESWAMELAEMREKA